MAFGDYGGGTFGAGDPPSPMDRQRRRSDMRGMGGFQLPRGGFNPQLPPPPIGGGLNFSQAPWMRNIFQGPALPAPMPNMRDRFGGEALRDRFGGFGGGGGRLY